MIKETRCANQAATEAVAATIASKVLPGDLIALTGDLGAGKTTFARAFIRAALSEPQAEVPSPTFTLVQTYDAPDGHQIYHTDLYRLQSPDEIYDLGLEEERADSVMLVEWPDRLPEDWRKGAVTFSLKRPAGSPQGEDEERQLVFEGDEGVLARLLDGVEL